MNRRDFHRALLGTLGAALLPADAGALSRLADPRTVDGERLLGQLRTLSPLPLTRMDRKPDRTRTRKGRRADPSRSWLPILNPDPAS